MIMTATSFGDGSCHTYSKMPFFFFFTGLDSMKIKTRNSQPSTLYGTFIEISLSCQMSFATDFAKWRCAKTCSWLRLVSTVSRNSSFCQQFLQHVSLPPFFVYMTSHVIMSMFWQTSAWSSRITVVGICHFSALCIPSPKNIRNATSVNV